MKTLLVVALLVILAVYLVSRMKEGYRSSEAALVCYWADPGPPLSVVVPHDPRSVSVRGGPQGALLKRKRVRMNKHKLQTKFNNRMLPTLTPQPGMTPQPSLPPAAALVPTLGVLSIPPEIKITSIPSTEAPTSTPTPSPTVAPTQASVHHRR